MNIKRHLISVYLVSYVGARIYHFGPQICFYLLNLIHKIANKINIEDVSILIHSVIMTTSHTFRSLKKTSHTFKH